MFHTLFDYKGRTARNNRIYPENDLTDVKNRFRFSSLEENYFGKGNPAIDQYNRKRGEMENDANFEKTKTKIKLVVYMNGFILNNGPFRDRSIPENNNFLSDVEKGIIPQELIRKGILDLGILLINRKSEMFGSPLYQSLPTSFNFINFSENQSFSQYLINEDIYQNNENSRNHKNGTPFVPQTPMITRNGRRNIFFDSKTFDIQNNNFGNRSNKRINSLPKDKKIITLSDIENKNNGKTKKFTAFSGNGQLLGSANIEGIRVDEEIFSNDKTDYMNFNNLNSDIGIDISSYNDYGISFNHFGEQDSYLTELVY